LLLAANLPEAFEPDASRPRKKRWKLLASPNNPKNDMAFFFNRDQRQAR